MAAIAEKPTAVKDYRVADVPVSLIGLTLPALTFALTLDRVLNGICRPFFGWVSDHIGRENTMCVAFGLEALGIFALARFGTDPVYFVILSGLAGSWLPVFFTAAAFNVVAAGLAVMVLRPLRTSYTRRMREGAAAAGAGARHVDAVAMR